MSDAAQRGRARGLNPRAVGAAIAGNPGTVARLGALLVLLIGVVLLVLAVAKATVWKPPSVTTARVTGQAGTPVIDTTADALALDGPSVSIQVTGKDASAPVFVGVGRSDDVQAYLADAARVEVTGVRGNSAVTASSGTQATLPEPAGVDVWALSATGRGSTTLTWPRTPGQWRVVAAGDGTAAPAQVVLTWQRDRGASSAPALLAVGILVFALGFVGLRVAGRWPATAGSGPREGAAAPGPSRARPGGGHSHRAEEPRTPPTGPVPHRVVALDGDADDEDEEQPLAPAPFRQPPLPPSGDPAPRERGRAR